MLTQHRWIVPLCTKELASLLVCWLNWTWVLRVYWRGQGSNPARCFQASFSQLHKLHFYTAAVMIYLLCIYFFIPQFKYIWNSYIHLFRPHFAISCVLLRWSSLHRNWCNVSDVNDVHWHSAISLFRLIIIQL